MRIFVTGASGWIGSHVVPELLDAGHQVLGLARSAESAATVELLGAEVHHGSLDELDSLREGAASCEGVVHLGYNHDFTAMGEAAKTDLAALNVFGDVLAGTDGPLVFAAGVLGLGSGQVATELDSPDVAQHPRIAGVQHALGFKDKGVRSVSVRFAPTVHGTGDHGFIATLVGIARAQGVSAYIGEGNSAWPAVHVLDAAALVRLALERAEAGTSVHAVAEQGVATKAIAEAIGAGLALPVMSVPVDGAMEHFGWMGRFFGMDAQASNAITRETLGWDPTHATLLEDLTSGSYFV
ncbi:MAG: 3-beta hydroxysteroid dehydrogenase [Frankiales bacterium]|nr:3-beta hydroxysteroid dehydrogenase [Frankiales bacterium]